MTSVRTFGREVFNRVMPPASTRKLKEGVKRSLTWVERQMYYGGEAFPTQVELETNGICNLTCSYCPRPSNDVSKTLETEVIEGVIGQLRDWDFRGQLSFHAYNEPLTDRRIPSLVRTARRELPRNDLYIFTNGTLLTPDKAAQLYEAGLTRIVATLHDPTPEKVVPVLEELKSKYKSRLDLRDLRTAHRQTQLRARGGAVALEQTEEWGYCNTVDVMVIRSTGDVVLCAEDVKMSEKQGNVRDTPIQDIWWSYKPLRDAVQKGKKPTDICKSCAYEKMS